MVSARTTKLKPMRNITDFLVNVATNIERRIYVLLDFFKLECEGTEIIRLCSKTYLVKKDDIVQIVNDGNEQRAESVKFSSKGVQQRNVTEVYNTFKSVLETRQSRSRINKGFWARSNTMFSYIQERTGFSYFYCKREVLANGIYTKPLNITLCPERKEPEDLKLIDILVELQEDE